MTDTQRAMYIAAEVGCDLRTATRFLRGERIRTNVLRERLEAAAKSLNQKTGADKASGKNRSKT